MKEYNKHERCVKCGDDHILDSYIPGCGANDYVDKMQRRCSNCGYLWKTYPLDHNKDE